MVTSMRGYLGEKMEDEELPRGEKQLLTTGKKIKPIKLLGQAFLFGKKGKTMSPPSPLSSCQETMLE